ncbi:WD40 repeat-like protein, partial [Hyaloscypha bicolor E]
SKLWERAFENLKDSGKHKDIIAIIKDHLVDTKPPSSDGRMDPNSTTSASKIDVKTTELDSEIDAGECFREAKDEISQEGEHLESTTREFVQKTVSVLNMTLSIGDVAVSFDPVHAALPWAAIRTVLLLITAYGNLKAQMLSAISRISSLVFYCESYYTLYLASDTSLSNHESALNELEASITEVYSQSLLCLGFIFQHGRSWNNAITAPFKLGDMDKYTQGLVESGNKLEHAASYCDKHGNHESRLMIVKLHELAKDFLQLRLDDAERLKAVQYNKYALERLGIANGVSFECLDPEECHECHRGTRVALLKDIYCRDIYAWVDDADSSPVFWLQGKAGTGKSTISQTVATQYDSLRALGASFFIKRGAGLRDKAARIFSTIAHQLAHRLPLFSKYLVDAIEEISDIPHENIKTQFETFILVRLVIAQLPRLNEISWVRVKCFVTSRPEIPILVEFHKITSSYRPLVLQDISEDVVKADISVYLQSSLSKIRDEYNLFNTLCPLESNWPGQTDLDILVEMSFPLFIFAKTVCRFVKDYELGGYPEVQRKKVFDYREFRSRGQHFHLHATYLPILERILPDPLQKEDGGHFEENRSNILEEFRDIVGAIINLADPLPVASLARLINKETRGVLNMLNTLQSVLNVPTDPETPVKLFHLSFRDFLVNREENPFYIYEVKTHENLVDGCLLLLSKHLHRNMVGLKEPGKLRIDIDQGKVRELLASDIRYACLYWVSHLTKSERRIRDGDMVHIFLSEHFLYWLEALSLLGSTSDSIGLIDTLRNLVEDGSNSVELSGFLYDAWRFVLQNRWIINHAPLQLYFCAIFAPESSIIKAKARDAYEERPVPPEMPKKWSPELLRITNLPRYVRAVAFCGDGKSLAACIQKTIRLWNIATGDEIQILEGHEDIIIDIAFSPLEPFAVLASGSHDYTVRLWNTNAGEQIWVATQHTDVVNSISFSANGQLIGSGSSDKTTRIWDAKTGRQIQAKRQRAGVDVVAFARTGPSIASLSSSGGIIVIIWNAITGEQLRELELPSPYINCMAFSIDGRLLASGPQGGNAIIRLWNVDTGQQVQASYVHDGRVEGFRFSPSNHNILALASSKGVTLWDIATGTEIRRYEENEHGFEAIAFSPNGQLLAVVTYSTVRVWATTTEDIQKLDSHNKRLNCLKVSPNQQLLATATSDNVKLWEVRTRKQIQTLNFDRDVADFSFSPDSQSLGVEISDYILRVWNVETGEVAHRFNLNSSVSATAFSSDGRKLNTVVRQAVLVKNHVVLAVLRFRLYGKGRGLLYVTCGNYIRKLVFL